METLRQVFDRLFAEPDVIALIVLALILGIGPSIPSVDADVPSILPCDNPLPFSESLPQLDFDWEPAPHPDWELISVEPALDRDCSCEPYI